jgi:prepilin-type N-terminal cleavage/methylation domain-containing protein
MKTKNTSSHRSLLAFTLIELLVVIAVMAILAALIFPVVGGIKKKAVIKRVETQLKAIESAIENYKANVGVYPPENPGNPALNPLFYELAGTTNLNSGTVQFQSSSGIGIANVAGFFGGGINGFVNVAKGSGDELQAAKNCISNIKPSQYLEVTNGGTFGTLLGITDVGPSMFTATSEKTLNPWRYTSSSATNNQGRYDLWVDVIIAGKTNRISNWTDKPSLVYY